jgi:DNA-binding response OmpR family regulator
MAESKMPILFLTAKSMKEDVIEGFSLGADDYMTKPFSIEELLMRIEAILRRTRKDTVTSGQAVYQIGNYTFDATKQTLQLGDEVRKLTTKESELLKYLCVNRNSVLDRNFASKPSGLTTATSTPQHGRLHYQAQEVPQGRSVNRNH